MRVISGSKGGSSNAHTPVEMADNLRSVDKIKILLALSDGEVAGSAANNQFHESMVYLDDVPLVSSDGTRNFDGVTTDFRYGRQDQAYIQGFADGTSAEVTVNRDVTYETPFTFSVTDTNISAVRVTLAMARGVTLESDGDQVGVNVDWKIQLAVDGGAYADAGTYNINGKTTSGYETTKRVNLPEFSSQVLVRVVRVTPDSTSSSVVDAIQVKNYALVVDAKFRYPLTALLYIELDSKVFPNALPNISVKKKWKLIDVPSNYNETTKQFDGTWDGTFKHVWSDNPAWVLYDLITNQRYGLDQRELGIAVDKWSLYEAGVYCAQMVPDGKGGTEMRYKCDVVIQSQVEAYQLIRDICSIFRGISFWNGESISVVIDKPRASSYLFTNDNVMNGTFNYTFASEKSMYTQCNVTFDDEQNMYKQDVEGTFDLEAANRFAYNPTSITAIGCVRRSEANRRGRWILKTNLRSATVTFTTGVEGMIPMIGDVISIADNFWSSALSMNLSGRISEVNNRQIFVPFKVDARAGDTFIINKPDGAPIRKTIASVSSDGKTIEITTGLGFVPEANQIFAIERSDIALQQYVITGIDKGDGEDAFNFNITALEYDPNKYDEIDYGVNIDDRPTSVVSPDLLLAPENVAISSYSRIVQGMSVETMVISWDKRQYATLYEVQWRKNEGNWINAGQTAATEVEIEGIYSGNYFVRVRAITSANVSSPWSAIASATLTGKVGEPGKPINLTASKDEVFGIRVKWGFSPGSEDTAYTEIYQSPTGSDDNGTQLTMIAYPGYEYWHGTMPPGHIVWYKARTIDKIGNTSSWTDWIDGMSSNNFDDIAAVVVADIENSEAFKELAESTTEIAAKQKNQAEAAIENALANNADVIHMRAENGKRKAEYTFAVSVIADEKQARVEAVEKLESTNGEINATIGNVKTALATETEARATQYDQLNAKITNEVEAGLVEAKEAIANETEARVTSQETMQATIDGNTASLATKYTSWATADSIGSMQTVKMGLQYKGQNYDAGYAFSLEGTDAAPYSQIVFDVDRFAIGRIYDGKIKSLPFFVQDGVTYMKSALIQDGTITMAKITQDIKSSNWDSGDNNPKWFLGAGGSTAGQFYLRQGNGSTGMTMDPTGISIRDASGVERVRLGQL